MNNDPVIEASSLPTLPAFCLLDARSAPAFEERHPTGAVRVPMETWITASQEEKTSLDNVAYWELQIRALGVGNDTPAVIYDDGRMIDAARVWFILQYFGAKPLIVNGGWPQLAGMTLTARPPGTSPEFKAQASSGSVGLVDRHQLKAQIENQSASAKLLDVRTAAEFKGEDLRRNKRGGHLPGAQLLPHAELMKDGKLLDPAALRSMLMQAGIQDGDAVVMHCDAGARAALASVAALRAGYKDVHAYYLSFADWARDDSCPLIRP